MTAKEYLSQVRLLDDKINCKLAEVARLQEMAARITPVLRNDAAHGTGGQKDRMAAIVAKIVDLKAEINMDIDRLVDRKKEVSALLDKIPNRRYYTVLFRRYILYETLDQISCEMGCTYRNVCYLHGQALCAVEKIMGE